MTKDEEKRFRLFQEIGCVACRKMGLPTTPADVHHLLSGGRRRGHMDTVPLCAWHHRGCVEHGTGSLHAMAYGPSLARSPKKFRETFGTDEELLAYTNKLIAGYLANA